MECRHPVFELLNDFVKSPHIYNMIAAAPIAIPPTSPATITALGSLPDLAVELVVDLGAEEEPDLFAGGGVIVALAEVELCEVD
jgi:hypothetical protein